MNRVLGNIKGFTLIELVMVILLIGVLAAVAIPNFIDFRTDAKNATTKGSVGALRSAISIARAAIQLREDPAGGAPNYPTAAEMQANAFTATHPVLSGTKIMDPASGVPTNPWTLTTIPSDEWSTIWDCDGETKAWLHTAVGAVDVGWCYSATSGQVWANSDRNGGGAGNTENNF